MRPRSKLVKRTTTSRRLAGGSFFSDLRFFCRFSHKPQSTSRVAGPSRCLSVAFMLLAPAVQADPADDSYAWIEPQAGKHASYARRRETILLRAARLAEERGYTHFELMRTTDTPVAGGVASDAWTITDAYGNASNSTQLPILTPSPVHGREGVLVRFCNESVESCPGVRAHRVLLNLRQ